MNTKEIYISPVIEIVEMETEGVIAASLTGDNDGPSYSKRRNRGFWNEEE